MNTSIFGFLIILLAISIISVADAQISLGEKAVQKSVEVFLSSTGDVHVKHVASPSNLPKDLELILGTVSNLSVTNEQGEEELFSFLGDNKILIQPSRENSIIEYDLKDVLSQTDDVWAWSFRYLEMTSFIFPKKVDLVFVNEQPVYLDKGKGITCHGCQMVLEYSVNEPKIFKDVRWKDQEFVVGIKSHSEIDGFIFDQPAKSITFDVSEKNRLVTTIFPSELLGEPYIVFLDGEKINFHKYANNGTHVWLGIQPETAGEVVIIGATVIPEFPIFAPLAIGFLIILVVPLVRKFNLR